MAKQAKGKTSTVSRGAGKVAAAIAKVYGVVAQNGNVITQCVSSAQSVYRGAAIPKADLSVIADTVARLRKWTPTSAGPRKSEVRKILRVYTRLPEAIQAYCKKHDSFTWHTAVKLARCLNREPSLRQALALMDRKAESKAITPLKACGNAVSKIMNLDTRTSKIVGFQNALEALAETHGIDW
jgi:hypothetical protein